MNWFQRYGIPGFYFFGLLSTLYVITNGIPCDNIIKFFVILFISVSVPVGYIITIIAQLFYYIIPFMGIQFKSLNSEEIVLTIPEGKHFKSFKRFFHRECDAEISGVYYGIIQCCGKEIKRGEWLQKWFNKRFDVWAINNSIITATLIGWFIFVLSNFKKKSLETILFCDKIFILLICSILILAALYILNHILKRQIKALLTEIYENLRTHKTYHRHLDNNM